MFPQRPGIQCDTKSPNDATRTPHLPPRKKACLARHAFPSNRSRQVTSRRQPREHEVAVLHACLMTREARLVLTDIGRHAVDEAPEAPSARRRIAARMTRCAQAPAASIPQRDGPDRHRSGCCDRLAPTIDDLRGPVTRIICRAYRRIWRGKAAADRRLRIHSRHAPVFAERRD